MYKIAIVEDSLGDTNRLIESLNKYSQEHDIEFNVTKYKSGVEFLDKFSHQFDLIFMDIQLPYFDGLKVSEELRKVDDEVGLIFVTNLAQFATHGYKVSALDYVVKPVVYSSFAATIKRCLPLVSKAKDTCVSVTFGNETTKVKIQDIVYCEVFSHVVTINLKNGEKLQARQSLSTFEENFSKSPFYFIRANSYNLVNPNYIKRLSKSEIALNNGTTITISRSKGNYVAEQFARYMGEK